VVWLVVAGAKLAWHDRERRTTTLQLDTTATTFPLRPIAAAMFLQRSAFAAARRAAPRAIARRTFTTSFVRRKSRRESYRTTYL
jgi:cytochrome c oxidase subunit 5b